MRLIKRGILLLIVLIFLINFVYAVDCPTNGLVSYWNADGNALDSTDSNDGTWFGNVSYVPGKYGQAFIFDGSPDYVVIPNNNNLDMQNELTISAWVNILENLTSRRIFDKVDYSNYSGYKLAFSFNPDNALFIEGLVHYKNDTGNGIYDKISYLPYDNLKGTWRHIAFVVSPTELKLYIDGNLQRNKTRLSSNPIQNSDKIVYIGAGNDKNLIEDEVRIYNKTLSDSEVTTLFNCNPVPQCADGLDNDNDGKIDYPNDKSCSSLTDNDETFPQQCSDLFDNDGDGFKDSADPGCFYGDTETTNNLICDNGIDETNDADILADFRLINGDPGCVSLGDPSEINGECDDKIDNDGDTKIDYGTATTNDQQCSSYSDSSESNHPESCISDSSCTSDEYCSDEGVCLPDNCATKACPSSFRCESNACVPINPPISGNCGTGYDCTGKSTACNNPTTGDFKPCDSYYYCTETSTGATCNNQKKYDGESCSSNYQCLSKNCAGGLCAKKEQTCNTLPNLVSWWTADSTIADSADTNPGYLVGNAKYEPGYSGEAFSFDGSGDYVRVFDSNNLDITNEITIVSWINPNDVTGTKEIVRKYFGSPGGYAMAFSKTTSDLVGKVQGITKYVGGSFNTVSTPLPSPGINHWYHVAFAVSQTQAKLYVDGYLRATEARIQPPKNIDPNTLNLGIGGFPQTSTNYFNGLIDETQIYNRALTQTEISALASGCPPIKQITLCTSNSDCSLEEYCSSDGLCLPDNCNVNPCPENFNCVNNNCEPVNPPTDLYCGDNYDCTGKHSSCINFATKDFKPCDDDHYCEETTTPDGATCANPKRELGEDCDENYECKSDECDYEEEGDTQKICLENEEESCSDVGGIICNHGCIGEPDEDVSELNCCTEDSSITDSPKCKGASQWIQSLGTSVRFDKTCTADGKTQVSIVDNAGTGDRLLDRNDPEEKDYLDNLGVTINPYIDSQDHSCNTDLFQSSTTGQPVPAYGLISILTSISLVGLFYVFRKKN